LLPADYASDLYKYCFTKVDPDPSIKNIDFDDTSFSFNVDANITWFMKNASDSVSSSMFDFGTIEGSAGYISKTVDVCINTLGSSPRSGYIIFYDCKGNYKNTMTVNQSNDSPYGIFTENSFTAPAVPYVYDDNVISGQTDDPSIVFVNAQPNPSKRFFTIHDSSVNNSSFFFQVRLDIDTNTGSQRTNILEARDASGDTYDSISIIQLASGQSGVSDPDALDISNIPDLISSGSHSYSITVTYSSNWTLSVSPVINGFVTSFSPSSGSGNATPTVYIGHNDTDQDRSTSIILKNPGGDIIASESITQQASF